MYLYKKQLEIQQSSYKLLLERVKKLKELDDGYNQSLNYAKAKGITKFFASLIKKIDNFKLEHLKEIVAYVIKNNENYILELLNSDYKNQIDSVVEFIRKQIEIGGDLYRGLEGRDLKFENKKLAILAIW